MSRTAPARARPRPRRSGNAAQAVSRRAIKIKYFQKLTRHRAPGRHGADAAVAWSRIPPSSLLLPLPVSLPYAVCSLFGENQTTSACRGRDEVRPGRIGAPEIGADLERHEAEVDEQGAGARVPAVEPHGVRREDLPGPARSINSGKFGHLLTRPLSEIVRRLAETVRGLAGTAGGRADPGERRADGELDGLVHFEVELAQVEVREVRRGRHDLAGAPGVLF